MQINYTGHNIEVTLALKSYTEEKLQRLKHRENNITNINIIFQVDNITHTAEGNLLIKGLEINAKGMATKDMYAAIDQLVDKLLTQITKHKEKTKAHR